MWRSPRRRFANVTVSKSSLLFLSGFFSFLMIDSLGQQLIGRCCCCWTGPSCLAYTGRVRSVLSRVLPAFGGVTERSFFGKEKTNKTKRKRKAVTRSSERSEEGRSGGDWGELSPASLSILSARCKGWQMTTLLKAPFLARSLLWMLRVDSWCFLALIIFRFPFLLSAECRGQVKCWRNINPITSLTSCFFKIKLPLMITCQRKIHDLYALDLQNVFGVDQNDALLHSALEPPEWAVQILIIKVNKGSKPFLCTFCSSINSCRVTSIISFQSKSLLTVYICRWFWRGHVKWIVSYLCHF